MNGVDRAAAPQQVLNSVKCECTEYGEPDRIKPKIWDFLARRYREWKKYRDVKERSHDNVYRPER